MKFFLLCTQSNTSGASLKIKMLWVVLLMVLSLNQAFAQYSGGAGTEGDPYEIATLADLRTLSATSGDWGKHFIQTADIDASATENDPFTPIAFGSRSLFTGSYNGGEHRISNLKIGIPDGDEQAALFSNISATGIVSNIVMVNANIISNANNGFGGGYAAFICSRNYGVIENCVVDGGTVDAERSVVGGICAENRGTIIACAVNNATIKGNAILGGIVGYNFINTVISECQVNNLTLSGRDGSSYSRSGGLIAWALGAGSVSKSFVNGVTISNGRSEIGGFVGKNDGATISDSYVIDADVNASDVNLGGFVGFAHDNSLTLRCYVATTTVGGNASAQGPFVGSATGNFTNCYYHVEIEGAFPSFPGSTEAKTVAELQNQATYVDWDFVDVWSIDAGQNDGFPTLNAVPAAGGPTCEDPVITQQPQDVTIQVGEDATFTVAATGDDLDYQWEVSGDNNSYAPLTDEIAATFGSTFNEQGTYYYRVQIFSGECSVTSEVATLTVMEAGSPFAVYSGEITALSNQAIAFPVMIAGFEGFRTLQGNIDFGSGASPMAFIDSVQLSEEFGSVADLAGDFNIIDNRVTYSYDKVTGDFSLPDGTVLFYVYGHLANSNQENFCFAPFDNEAATAHQFGRMEGSEPQIVYPTVTFEPLCVSAGEEEDKTLEVGAYTVPCPAEALTLPVSYTGYFDEAEDFTVSLDGVQIASFPVGQFAFTVPEDVLVAGSNELTIAHGATFSVTHDVVLNEFEEPVLNVNENPFDSETDFCPGESLSVVFTQESAMLWGYSINGGTDFTSGITSKELEIATTDLQGTQVLIQAQVYNEQGCLSQTVHTFAISVQDREAPVAQLLKTYYPYWGATSVTLEVDDIEFNALADNCNTVEQLAVAFTGGQQLVTVFESGEVGVTVTDIAGNQREVFVMVEFLETPQMELRQTEYLTTYYSKNENETITVGAHLADGDPAFFTSLSGTVDFDRLFTRERGEVVSLISRLPESYGELTLEQDGEAVSYSINFNQATLDAFTNGMNTQGDFNMNVSNFLDALEDGIFEIVIVPSLVFSGEDVQYTPEAGADDAYPVMGAEATSASVSFENEANTLQALSRFVVTLNTESGNEFVGRRTAVTCASCVEDGDNLEKTLEINSFRTAAIFFTPSTEPFSLVFEDKSGDDFAFENEFAIGTEDAIANRQFIVNARQFSAEQSAKGDVDGDTEINTLDVLQIRQKIAGDRDIFINAYGQESPYNYLFLEDGSYQPVVDYTLDGVANKTFGFTVFAVGDVAEAAQNAEKSNDVMALVLGSAAALPGERVSIPVTVGNFENVAGYQFTVNWDPTLLDYQGVKSVNHAVYSGDRYAHEGNLGLSWIDSKAANASLMPGDTLFMVDFEVLPAGQNISSTQVNITSSTTPYAAYNEALHPLSVSATAATVNFTTTSIMDLGSGYGIGNPYPNPFTVGITVAIELPGRENVSIRVYDSHGKVIERQELMEAGVNYWTLENHNNLKPGMYFLEVQCAGFKKVMKLIRQ